MCIAYPHQRIRNAIIPKSFLRVFENVVILLNKKVRRGDGTLFYASMMPVVPKALPSPLPHVLSL